MVHLILSITLSLLLCGSNNLPGRYFSQPNATPHIQRVTYRTYTNVRFQYSVSYPAGILIPQGESTNSDGQIFRSRDRHAEMRVFGRYNVQDETLQSAFNAAQEGKDVTYKALKGNFYVVSGRQNGKIFYEKTMLKGDTFKTFMIEYDESESAKYDPITARIARSFVG
ncbi:MAG: hypothetical protein DMF68_03190 [Acidobacteria bacterium]|nr:MAG: hypothetical protein DMF68_03190 [Acidobacteriota bacterium]